MRGNRLGAARCMFFVSTLLFLNPVGIAVADPLDKAIPFPTDGWGNSLGREPSTDRDRDGDYMWQAPDPGKDGDNDRVFLDGVLVPSGTGDTSTGISGVGGAEYRVFAYFGAWRDCNGDRFMGNGAILTYRSEELRVPQSVCPPHEVIPDGPDSWPAVYHNDGRFVHELLWLTDPGNDSISIDRIGGRSSVTARFETAGGSAFPEIPLAFHRPVITGPDPTAGAAATSGHPNRAVDPAKPGAAGCMAAQTCQGWYSEPFVIADGQLIVDGHPVSSSPGWTAQARNGPATRLVVTASVPANPVNGHQLALPPTGLTDVDDIVIAESAGPGLLGPTPIDGDLTPADGRPALAAAPGPEPGQVVLSWVPPTQGSPPGNACPYVRYDVWREASEGGFRHIASTFEGRYVDTVDPGTYTYMVRAAAVLAPRPTLGAPPQGPSVNPGRVPPFDPSYDPAGHADQLLFYALEETLETANFALGGLGGWGYACVLPSDGDWAYSDPSNLARQSPLAAGP